MKKLSKDYNKTLAELDKSIGSYYSKYGENNVIEYRKLLEQLSEADRRLLYEKMDMFSLKYPEYSHLMPTRESIYKLNRLEGLQQEVYIRQCELGIISEKQLQEHLSKIAKKGYKTAGGRNLFNSDALNKLVNRKWVNGENFSDRIWKNTNKLGKHIVKDFQNAVIRGDSYAKCAKELQRRFNVSKKDAHRLVYTEGTYIMNESSMTAFEEEYEEYEYSAVVDSKTSEVCASLNGKIFKIKDRQPGVNFPPMHPRCRSSYVIVINEKQVKKEAKRKRIIEKNGVKTSSNYYQDITSDWKIVDAEKRIPVADLKEYVVEGVKYVVDGNKVILDYSEHEKKVAEMLSAYGKEVLMVPRIVVTDGIKTPDYIADNEKYDLKTPEGGSKNTIYNQVKGKKKQANNFIIALDKTSLDMEQVEEGIKSIYSSKHTAFVENIILVRDYKIIKVFKK